MKYFYKDPDDDLTGEQFRALRNGNWIPQPKRGMFYDAHDRAVERHYYPDEEERGGVRDKAKWFLLVALFIVFGVAMMEAGIW
jgi:hypothetical protein